MDKFICKKVFIEPLKELNEEYEQDNKKKKTVSIEVYGERVDLDLVETNQIQCPETLCRGLVFNDYGRYTIFVEVDGKRIQPDFNNVTRMPREFVAPKEWQTTKKLDWNRSVNKWQDGKFCCSIEVDGKFDEKMLRYNIAYPVSIRVGKKVYRYNRPILTSVDYKGANYSLIPYIRHTINDWTLDGFEIPDIRNIRLNEPSL